MTTHAAEKAAAVPRKKRYAKGEILSDEVTQIPQTSFAGADLPGSSLTHVSLDFP
jgi:hypothetical protein